MDVLTNILLGTLLLSAPLLLAALGESVVQRSGVVNVGLEGMILVGAFGAAWGTFSLGNPYVGLLCAALAAMTLGLLFATFAVKMAANQVVVGVVINLLAMGLTGVIYRARFGATGTALQTPLLPGLIGKFNLLNLLALGMVPAIWLWLRNTRQGLELRACGEQPIAAEASGVNPLRMRFGAILFGGAMGGLAGAFLSVGYTGAFIENMSAGRGFIALAIVTSGRWNAWGCLAAALIFGFVDQLQAQGQALGLKLPYQLFLALPYLATLLILASGGKLSQAPAALGRPYRRA